MDESLKSLSAPLTCNPLHFHASGLDATLGQPLLGDDAADVVSEDEVGLQDGQGLGMGVGAGLVDDDVQCSAVVLNARNLHVLLREGTKSGLERLDSNGERQRCEERGGKQRK